MATLSFVNTSDTRLDINQFTNSSLIDWRSFSIDLGEVTNFNMPSSSSVSVNRVTGGSVSEIFGTLSSNGRVLLLNTNGILFGAGSRVDVSGLVATTTDIDVAAYTEGRFSFSGASDSTASVVNRGTITVADGGLAALVAPGVENSGAIVANLGTVSLASGNAFTIDLFGDGLVSMAAGSQVLSQAIGPDGQPLDAMVANSGSIQANGGLVLLSVDAAQGLVDNVINMSGVILARSISSQNGEIILSGGDNGIVNVTGTLDASGKSSGETGGTVKLLGKYVGLFDGARIDVSGDAGGGTALIGGNYKGQGAEQNADVTYVAEGTTILANAVTSGDGGMVIVWSDQASYIYGKISVRGGTESGDGGLVETSSKGYLDVTEAPDFGADNGSGGYWLLDPTNIVINTTDSNTANAGGVFTSNTAAPSVSTINVATLVTAINAAAINSTIEINTAGGTNSGEVGTITLASALSANPTNTGVTLLFTANSTITINSSITAATNALNVTLNTITTAPVAINQAITTNGGNFTVTNATAYTQGDFDIAVGAGNINIQADTIAITNNIGNNAFSGTGTLTLRSTVAGATIGLGAAATGTFNLTDVELTDIADGFSSITIGNTNSGAVDINAFTFLDPVTIQGAAMVVTALQAVANNITLTSTSTIDEDVDNTTADITTTGTLTLTAQGAIGVSGGNGALDLVVGTLQATATTGGIFLLEASGLIIGGTGVQTTGGNAAIEIALTLGNLTLNEDITANGSGNVTLTLSAVGGQVITDNAVDDIASTSGDITITADTLTLALGNITSSGALILQPNAAARTIGLGGTAGGDFNLDATELGLLSDGFTSITIGKTDSGAVDINAFTFLDPVTIQSAAMVVTALQAGSNNITLTSTSTIDEDLDNTTVDITTSGTLSLTAQGAIGVSAGTGELDLVVGTLQATTTTGGIFLLEADGLIIGGTGVQTTGANAAIEITLTLGDLTLNDDITANGSGNVTLTVLQANNAVITGDGDDDIASTSGAITITADRLTLAGGNITSTGALILQPNAASETIGLGDGATGDFNLDATELGLLTGTFSSITIGKTDSGAVDINTFTFLDPVTIQGAAMTVTGLAAGSLNITLTSTSTIDEDADDTTADITTSGILNLTAQGAIGASGGNGALDLAVTTLQATTNAGGIFLLEASGLTIGSGNVQTSAANAAIEIALTLGNLTLDGDITANGSGNVTLTLSGAGAQVITSAGTDNIASTSGDITITADALTLAIGTISSSGALILQPNAVGTDVGVSAGIETFNISTTELDLLSDGFSSITIGRSDGTATLTVNADVFRDAMVFRMGGTGGNITTAGILTSAVANTALTFTAGTGDGSFTMTLGAGNTIASGTGAITITADVVVLNTTANTITGTGASTITLQPSSSGVTIGIGGGSGTFNLAANEIAALTDGFTSITIGKTDSGAVDINAITFNDPVTIQGGAMTVTALQTGGTIITLTSTSTIDEDGDNTTTDITTSGTLVLTAQGAIGVSGGNGPLDLAVGILQATTTTGGIFVLESSVLVIRGTGVQTTGANAPIEITVTAGDLVLDEDVTADGSGNVTLTVLGAGSALITGGANDDIVSTSGAITITADVMTLAAANITSSGALILQPNAAGTAIGLGGGAGGAFNLDATELGLLSDGFSSITIGKTDSGAVDINAFTFLDPVNIQGAAMLIAGLQAGANNITLTSTSTIDEAGDDVTVDITTSGTLSLTAQGAIGATGGGNNPLDLVVGTLVATTTSGGIFLLEASGLIIGGTGVQTTGGNAAIEITLTLGNLTLNEDITADGSGAVTLTLSAGGAQVITDSAVDDIASGSGDITITADALTLATGTISSSGALILQPNAVGTDVGVSAGAQTFNISTTELDLLSDGFSSITIGRSDGTATLTVNADVFRDAMVFRMGGVSGDITTVGALTSATANTALTFTAGSGDGGTFTQTDTTSTIASGSGNITITADTVVLSTSANSITGTGTITLEPSSASRTIVIGAAGGVTDFALNVNEIAALTNGFSSITIGKADSGAVTISAITFNDPVTIQGAAITVDGLAAGSNNITLTSTSTIDEDADDTTADITTSGILNLTAQGAIGASGGNGALDLAVTTLQATTNAGGIFLLEASGLTIGSGNVQTSAANAAIEIALTLGNLTLDGDITANGSGNVTLTLSGAGAQVITSAGTDNIASTSGDITITADALTLAIGTISSSGALILQPNAVGTDVGVSAGIETFNISTTELDLLSDGFSSITIGRSDGTATLTVNADVFRDAMVFRMGGTGGNITTAGILTSAVANTALTFTAGTGDGSFTMTLGAGNTIASGTGAITITADVVVLNTTANTITGTGASTITLQPATGSTTIGISDGASGTFDLDLSEIGAVTDGFSLITIGASGGTGAVDINAFTFNDPVTIRGGAMVVTALQSGGTIITLTSTSTIDEDGDNTTTDITTSGTLVLTAQGAIGVSGGNGPLDLAVGILQATTTTGGIFLLENNTLVIGGTGVQTTGGNAAIEIALTLGNLTLNEDITADGSGNITLTLLGAGAILATSAAGVDDIISGSGDITITADALTLAGGVITSSGNLVLQPNATDVAVGVSGGAGAFALATTEIDLLSNGFGSITIGRSDSTALMTINADAFLDPINFRMGGVSGDITLAGAVTTASLAMTFTAGTGATGTFTQSGGGTIATTAGAITITADAIVLDTVNPNTITTIGAITLQPATATTSIGIGGASGTFQLDDAELLTLTNAAASITIGRSDGVHVILIDAIAFTDPVTIRTPNGGSIAVNGNLAASSEATVTLTAGGGQGNTGALGTITIANTFTVSTASQTITLTAQGNITLENVNAVAGNVTITSSQGSILETSTDNLITGATVTLNGSTAAGQSVGVSTGAINTNATTLSGTAGTGGFFVDDSASFGISTITITGAGAVTLIAVAAITDADASAAANITTTGAVSLTAGTFVGTSAANEEVDIDNATALTIDVNEDFHIDGVGGDLVLSDLTITLNTGSGADANTYVLNGISNNTLTLTDATADLTLTAFDQAVAASNLTLINDSGIITVTSFDNTGSGKLTLTASSGGIVLNDGSIATSSGAVTLSASTTITDGDVTAGNADITATGLVSLTGATGVGATGAAAAIDIATATSLAIDTNESFNIVGATLTVTDISITLNTRWGPRHL